MVAPTTPRETVLAALASGRTRTQVAADLGLSYWQVTRMATRAGRPIAPAARAETWEPLCMEPEDWALWQDTNRRLQQVNQAPRPCDDCLLGYAAEMRALGRCNGQPGGDAHDEDEEEEPSMSATEIQLHAWNAYHRLGSQSAAGRELGLSQGGVRSALLGYMRAEGIDATWIPSADPAMVREPQPTDLAALVDHEATDEEVDAVMEAVGVVESPADHAETIPVAERTNVPDPLSLIDRELERLAEEDAALVERAREIVQARTDVAARLERVRSAAELLRELASRAA